MTTAEDLIYLVKSHVEGDNDRFLTVASQVAAREARQGRVNVAESLKKLILKAREQKSSEQPFSTPAPLSLGVPQFKGELANLISVSLPRDRLSHMVLDQTIEMRLRRILEEQKRQEQLRAHGLLPRSKILLIGPPGSGKTLTAHALAGELDLPLMTIQSEAIMTKYLGESANKLKIIFEAMYSGRGVYFFDEFDSLGSKRNSPNDVGEIRRILNSFLQMIEGDRSHSLIVAATNHSDLLDTALFRRFDDIISYKTPNEIQAINVIKNKLSSFSTGDVFWDSVTDYAYGLGYADLSKAADDAAKLAIFRGSVQILTEDLIRALEERKLSIQ